MEQISVDLDLLCYLVSVKMSSAVGLTVGGGAPSSQQPKQQANSTVNTIGNTSCSAANQLFHHRAIEMDNQQHPGCTSLQLLNSSGSSINSSSATTVESSSSSSLRSNTLATVTTACSSGPIDLTSNSSPAYCLSVADRHHFAEDEFSADLSRRHFLAGSSAKSARPLAAVPSSNYNLPVNVLWPRAISASGANFGGAGGKMASIEHACRLGASSSSPLSLALNRADTSADERRLLANDLVEALNSTIREQLTKLADSLEDKLEAYLLPSAMKAAKMLPVTKATRSCQTSSTMTESSHAIAPAADTFVQPNQTTVLSNILAYFGKISTAATAFPTPTPLHSTTMAASTSDITATTTPFAGIFQALMEQQRHQQQMHAAPALSSGSTTDFSRLFDSSTPMRTLSERDLFHRPIKRPKVTDTRTHGQPDQNSGIKMTTTITPESSALYLLQQHVASIHNQDTALSHDDQTGLESADVAEQEMADDDDEDLMLLNCNQLATDNEDLSPTTTISGDNGRGATAEIGSASNSTGFEGPVDESMLLQQLSSDKLSLFRTSTLTSMHLRKAKLMFFYVRYPSSSVLKIYFPDVAFNKNNTAQLVKWFSNFREFYYINIEKYVRQMLAEAPTPLTAASVDLNEMTDISRTSELFKVLNMHYNRNNQLPVPPTFMSTVRTTVREFMRAILLGRDVDPSWKKQIYKVIARLDEPLPAFLRSVEWMHQQLSSGG